MNQIESDNALLISEQEAKFILEPHLSAFRQVMENAWQDWISIPDEQRVKLDARSRASCLYAFIMHHAKTRFDNVPGLKLIEKRGLFLVDVNDKVVVRFKKLGANKKTRNASTKQQITFGLQLELPGMPQAVRLNVGYVLNLTQTAFEDLFVTLQQGRKLKWDFPIPEISPSIIEMPVTAAHDESRVRVRAKNQKEIQRMHE